MSEWISVKDRLPAPGEWVLVIFSGSSPHDRDVTIGALSEDGLWYDDFTMLGGDGYLCFGTVSHWQPLPHSLASENDARARTWVSLKERLPKTHECVLIYAEEQAGIVTAYLPDDTTNYFQSTSGFETYRFEDVTYWQPLPAPPSGKDKENND